MGRKEHLQLEKKQLVKKLLEAKDSERKKIHTQREIAQLASVSQSSVSKAAKFEDKKGKENRGRKAGLTERQKRHIISTISSLAGNWFVNWSSQCVLKRFGCFSSIMEPSMRSWKQHHRWVLPTQKREWSATDFSEWIFSDEKRFNLDGPDGVYCYWRLGTELAKFRSKRSFGGGSVMFWGAVQSWNKVALVEVEKTMKAQDYQAISCLTSAAILELAFSKTTLLYMRVAARWTSCRTVSSRPPTGQHYPLTFHPLKMCAHCWLGCYRKLKIHFTKTKMISAMLPNAPWMTFCLLLLLCRRNLWGSGFSNTSKMVEV